MKWWIGQQFNCTQMRPMRRWRYGWFLNSSQWLNGFCLTGLGGILFICYAWTSLPRIIREPVVICQWPEVTKSLLDQVTSHFLKTALRKMRNVGAMMRGRRHGHLCWPFNVRFISKQGYTFKTSRILLCYQVMCCIVWRVILFHWHFQSFIIHLKPGRW